MLDAMKEIASGVYEGCLTYKYNKDFVDNTELVDWQFDKYDLISFGKVGIAVERLDSDI